MGWICVYKREDHQNVLKHRLRSCRDRRAPIYAQGNTSTETGGDPTRKQVSIGTLTSMGNGSKKLPGTLLENPIAGVAYQLVLHNNRGEDEEDVRSQLLIEYLRATEDAQFAFLGCVLTPRALCLAISRNAFGHVASKVFNLKYLCVLQSEYALPIFQISSAGAPTLRGVGWPSPIGSNRGKSSEIYWTLSSSRTGCRVLSWRIRS